MTNAQIVLAGFGGQGVLFAGKILAACGMATGKQVSWLPSYGPEMRGGTANVSVAVSDRGIGSPLVLTPNMLAVLNQPSFEKFEPAAAEGAVMVVNSTLIFSKSARSDLSTFYIPATQLAQDHSFQGLANIIVLGKLIRETGLFTAADMEQAIRDNVPASKAHLIEPNLRAFQLGFEYTA